ncbi:MAG TPA: sugar transferase [Rhizomicrobium sp.]
MLDSLGTRRDIAARENSADPGWRVADSHLANRARRIAGMRDAREPVAAAPLGGRTKRCLDLLLSLSLLPALAIVALPVALVIWLGGGKPIYWHLRVGWNGRLFRCYKFRTMIAHADAALETLLRENPEARQQWLERHKIESDPRVTPTGWFLRKTNLDEIPQIWNVLRGEMSWVGPRPVVPEELCRYGTDLSAYLACRPGVTGPWQVSRRGHTPYSERVRLDVDYKENWSVARDLAILFLTIPRIYAANVRSEKCTASVRPSP